MSRSEHAKPVCGCRSRRVTAVAVALLAAVTTLVTFAAGPIASLVAEADSPTERNSSQTPAPRAAPSTRDRPVDSSPQHEPNAAQRTSTRPPHETLT